MNGQLAHIDLVQDDRLFGLFPEFKPSILAHRSGVVNGLARLAALDRPWLEFVVAEIPAAWQVDAAGRAALVTLLVSRAQFVIQHFSAALDAQLGPQDTIL